MFFAAGPFLKPLLEKEIVYLPNNQKYLSWRIGIIYLFAAAAQVIGFWLKRNRIAQAYNHQVKLKGSESFTLVGGIFISVMHFLIFGVLIVNDGINYVNNQSAWWLTIIKAIAILLPTITALIVSYYASRHKEIDRLNAINTFWDLTGTILLSLSCFVAVASYWQFFFGDLNFNFNDGQTFKNLMFSLVLFAGFLLLYLPARWAFLLMDYKSGYTWLRMAIVFIPFLKGLWLGWHSWLW